MLKQYIRFITAMIMMFILPNITDASVSKLPAINNIFAFDRVSKVLPAPDGKQVAYTIFRLKPNIPQRQWEYSLYLKDKSGQISLLLKADTIASPAWSPDGHFITYLAKGKKYQSLWVIGVNTKKSHKLLELNRDIYSFKWALNGNKIAFVADDDRIEPSSANLKPINVENDYVNSRLYLLPINRDGIKNGDIKPLTPATYTVPQYFEAPAYDWSPDSRFIAFTHQQRPGQANMNQCQISIVDIISTEIKNIPFTEQHGSLQPVYSPDGKWLAFQTQLEHSEKASLLNSNINLNNRICAYNLSADKTTCLQNTPNQNPGILGWNRTNNEIYVMDSYKAIGYQIYAISIDPKNVIPISNVEGFIEPLTITFDAKSSQFGFGYETFSKAPQAYISGVNPFELKQISNLTSFLEKTQMGDIKTIHWKSIDGMDIEGLLITPTNYDASKKYPLMVNVHGGPAGAWAKRYLNGCDEYEVMIDPTTCWGHYLQSGFIVFAPNPRGSTGYGYAFRMANFADLGGADYQDIMSGIKYLIHENIADENHLAIGGWSFGGYMSAWAISQNNMFKAAVDGDGNTDFISFSGTSDIPDYYPGYLGSTFWDDDHLYLERAPISHVKKITTPLLILQGESDHRVPSSQAYELYTALKKQNKPVEMYIFPEQGHLPTNPNIIHESILKVNNWVSKAIH